MKRKDLTGKIFGWLTVIKPVEDEIKFYNGKKQAYAKYLCRCKCGNEVEVRGNSLTQGLTKSCGCYRVYSGQNNADNLLGMQFGKLKVLSKFSSIKNKGIIWKCQCKCGNITYVQTSSLKNGNTKSCGCDKHPKAQNLIGKKFGRLIVLDYYKKGNTTRNTLYLCKCSCGNIKIVSQKELLSGKTKSCGCLHKESSMKNLPIKIVDLKGKRFGKLVVLEITNQIKRGSKVWKCKCDCGKITYKTEIALNRKGGGVISCGCANSKGNVIIDNILKSKNINYKSEFSFKDLVGLRGGLLRFDFAIFNHDMTIKYLIEYDGIFHYKQQYSVDSYNQIVIHDKLKNEYCKLHNYKLIRIPYWEKENIKDIINNLLTDKQCA